MERPPAAFSFSSVVQNTSSVQTAWMATTLIAAHHGRDRRRIRAGQHGADLVQPVFGGVEEDVFGLARGDHALEALHQQIQRRRRADLSAVRLAISTASLSNTVSNAASPLASSVAPVETRSQIASAIFMRGATSTEPPHLHDLGRDAALLQIRRRQAGIGGGDGAALQIGEGLHRATPPAQQASASIWQSRAAARSQALQCAPTGWQLQPARSRPQCRIRTRPEATKFGMSVIADQHEIERQISPRAASARRAHRRASRRNGPAARTRPRPDGPSSARQG